MIKTDRQLANSRSLAKQIEAAIAAHAHDKRAVGVDEEMHRTTLAASRGMLERVLAEIADYEALKAGDARGIRIQNLEDIPLALIQTRILRGLTQKALAKRLNLAEQQIQRWELRNYETAGFTNLLAVADALEFDIASATTAAVEQAAATGKVTLAAPAAPAGHRYGPRTGIPAWPRWDPEAGFDPVRFLHVLQRANTFNQTAVVQYTYVGGERHKLLKEALRKGDGVQVILARYADLLRFLNDAFESATAHNVRFLATCFDDRDPIPPRICLKGNLSADSTDWVVPLYRSKPVDYDSRVRIDGNTGFARVREHGGYYVEDNIPAAALRGDYVNPRLDTERIARDFGSYSEANLAALTEAWPAYWRPAGGERAPDAYRSTLIMPLKLWDNRISPQFKEVLENRRINTAIFGYLCIDHPKVKYFDHPVDLNISKIFADALCALVLLRLNFTVHSKTVQAVREMPEVQQWEDHALSPPPQYPLAASFELGAKLWPEFRTPATSSLVSLDLSLQKYLRVGG